MAGRYRDRTCQRRRGFFYADLRLDDLSMVSYQWGLQTFRPVDEDWHVTDIMSDINADAGGQENKVTLMIDHMYYNKTTFEYFRYILDYPFELAMVAYLPGESTNAQINEDLSQVDYIVAKTGEQGPFASNYRNDELRDDLTKDSSMFFLLREYELPDGSVALLYKHK